jgi:F0F1-type ATP synthase alpha subunit
MKLELANYREVKAFAEFGSDLDEATTKLLDSGSRLTELLKQAQFVPLDVNKQIVLMFAASLGALNKVALEDVSNFEQDVLAMLEGQYFFLSRIANNELTPADLKGIFGVCANMINNK